ncbi:endo alpha-1,4 polygalactosaminidase [uncultured Microbacterium sp.]|uniref:endo alpha-1,4 polygalactosaminidase n=1 Tax=uncultured Microbacterium sp. TaxID=191216 RepID=UPI0026071448|nr:endo alpha-1,4 polygalactosaminidase [uncultured Microbacterium sp.]
MNDEIEVGGRALLALGGVALTAALLAGCATASAPVPTPPPTDAGFDYQLGGAYEPPSGVTVVERDHTTEPAGLGYDICYVNGFQTQPGDSAAFAKKHPDLVLRQGGEPVADPEWPDEYLFDTSTAQKRSALAQIVGGWISGCRDSGFDAVEIDNLDSFSRSGGALTAKDNLALAEQYARAAHDAGLAIAQKNTAELSARLHARGYDFAVTESCEQFSECDAYTDVYPVVLDIEYTDELGVAGFRKACDDADRPAVMILRDHDLVTPDDEQYHYEACER